MRKSSDIKIARRGVLVKAGGSLAVQGSVRSRNAGTTKNRLRARTDGHADDDGEARVTALIEIYYSGADLQAKKIK